MKYGIGEMLITEERATNICVNCKIYVKERLNDETEK
jgi:hypothetical protein